MSQFDELPKGWKWVELSDIATIKSGLTKGKRRKDIDELKEVPYLRVANVQRGYLDLDEIKLIQATPLEIGSFLLKKGDILFTEGGDRDKLGRGWIWNEEILGCIHQNHIFRARLYDSSIDSRLISFYSNTHGQKYFLGEGRQTTNLASINLGKLSKLPIPLPPLNEQQRIVEKIEALTARSRKARAALDEIPALLDQFRQSVLAAAFRGDLTADWRAQNPNVEPAEALLERIRVERRKRWEASIKLRSESSSKYKIPFELDIDKLPELPDSWTWGSLDQLLFSLRNGLSRKPAEEMPGIPILRISALRPMALNINDIRYYQLSNGENVDSYLLEKGDLLFTRYNGNRDFVGVCGSVKNLTGKLLHPDKLIRGKPVSSHLFDLSFLEIACNSGISRRFIDGYVKTSAGQHGISGSDLKRTPIPIPPIDEQYAIMALVNKQFGIIDNLQILIENKFDEFQVFDQSILAKAFRGELVPQDPNDEPAAVLLDRIRAERERQGGSKKRGKAKA